METVNVNESMLDAINEIKDMSLDTLRRYALTQTQRAQLAEGKVEKVKRNFWGAVCEIWDDEEADDLIAKLIKRSERGKSKR